MATRVYTRGGDKGTTSLLSGGRVEKDHLRVEAYGVLDELQAYLGLARARMKNHTFSKKLFTIQENIFTAGAELSWEGEKDGLHNRLDDDDVGLLEEWIDHYTAMYTLPQRFIVPGECERSALLHVARTICRRGERLMVGLNREQGGFDVLLRYFNRLSDLLFIMAWGLEVESLITQTVLKSLKVEDI